MTYKMTYQEVKDQLPKALKELETKIRNSKSKYKDTPMEDRKYTIQVAEMVQSMSAADLFSGNFPEEKEETVDEVVERRVENSFASLEGRINSSVYSVELPEVPQKVRDIYRETEEESRAETERFENLTDEEKQKEQEELLKELSKYGGFMAFGVKQ